MRVNLVPTDFAWLSDSRLRETLLANIREKVELSVRELAMTRAFAKVAQDVRVIDVGDSILVEVPGRAGALERGAPPRQMTGLEGSTIPIKTASGGTIFRKATRLSMLLGKWKSEGTPKTQEVKGAIDRAMATSAETVGATKAALEDGSPPRVRDILGIR